MNGQKNKNLNSSSAIRLNKLFIIIFIFEKVVVW